MDVAIFRTAETKECALGRKDRNVCGQVLLKFGLAAVRVRKARPFLFAIGETGKTRW